MIARNRRKSSKPHCQTTLNPSVTLFTRYMYVFNTYTQDPAEGIGAYVNRLRKLSSTCKYGSLLNEMIRDRIAIGVWDSAVRARLFRPKNLTLEKCIDTCHASEMTTQQLKAIDGEVETLHAVNEKKKRVKSKMKTAECMCCGMQHPKRKCPAWGHHCKKCGRQKHFASACSLRLAKVHQVDNSNLEDSGSESSVFTVESGRTKYLVEPAVRFRRSGSWMLH